MGEAFAYFCWHRLQYPMLSRLFPNSMRDVSFDHWRMLQRGDVNGDGKHG